MHYSSLASYSGSPHPNQASLPKAPLMSAFTTISPVTGELMVPGNAGVVIQADSGKEAIRVGGTAMTSNMTLPGIDTSLNQIQFYSNGTMVSAFDQNGLYFPDSKGVYFGNAAVYGALTYAASVTTVSAPTTINLRIGATNVASFTSTTINFGNNAAILNKVNTRFNSNIIDFQNGNANGKAYFSLNYGSCIYFNNPTNDNTWLMESNANSQLAITNPSGGGSLYLYTAGQMFLGGFLGTNNPLWCATNNHAGLMISNNWNNGNPTGGTAGYYKIFCNGDKNIYHDFHDQIVYRCTYQGGLTVSNTILTISHGRVTVGGDLVLNGGIIAGYSTLSPSDFRLKNTIEPIDTALDSILKLKPSTFFYNAKPDKQFAGFIAQDILPIIPLAVEKRDDDYYYLNQTSIIPYLVKAVQELSAQVTELTKQVSSLKNDK